MLKALIFVLAVGGTGDMSVSRLGSATSGIGNGGTVDDDNPLSLGTDSDCSLVYDSSSGDCWVSCGHRASDVAPADIVISGGNAYDQATVNVTGGDLVLAPGIGFSKIVCSDRTVADTDTVTFTVNGTATVLTESTDFDCEGEASEEVCCDNLGAAITTAALGVTPDCDTTAGTCYLSFDASVVGLRLAIADGGVNGAFGTATDGAEGNIWLGKGGDLSTSAKAVYLNTDKAGFSEFLNDGNGRFLRFGGNTYDCAITTAEDSTSLGGLWVDQLVIGGTWGSTSLGGVQSSQMWVQGSIYNRSAKRAYGGINVIEEQVTFANDASKTTTGSILPDEAFIFGVSGRVGTALAGCTDVDVGDGVDVDLFVNSLATAQGSTFDGGDATASYTTIANGYLPRTAAGEITVTANGGNCTAGVVTLTVNYIYFTAATQN